MSVAYRLSELDRLAMEQARDMADQEHGRIPREYAGSVGGVRLRIVRESELEEAQRRRGGSGVGLALVADPRQVDPAVREHDRPIPRFPGSSLVWDAREVHYRPEDVCRGCGGSPGRSECCLVCHRSGPVPVGWPMRSEAAERAADKALEAAIEPEKPSPSPRGVGLFRTLMDPRYLAALRTARDEARERQRRRRKGA